MRHRIAIFYLPRSGINHEDITAYIFEALIISSKYAITTQDEISLFAEISEKIKYLFNR
jgi:hypothetical protein